LEGGWALSERKGRLKAWLCIALILAGSNSFTDSSATESLRSVYDKGKGALVLDLSIGAETDDDEDVFLYNPTRICVDSDGDILLIDPLMPCISKFDRDGLHVWTIDSKGQGPEDIRTPTRIALAPDGTIIVYDIGNRRFGLISKDGQFLKTFSISDWVWGLNGSPCGDIWVETRLADFDGKRGGTLIRLLRYSSDFESVVVVDSTLIKTNTYISEPVRTNVPVPFAPVMAWDVTPSGNIVIARSSDYSVNILSPTFELITQFRPAGKRIEVTEDDKKSHFDGMTTNTNGTIEKGAPTYIRNNTDFPKYKPYFSEMHVDGEGYILFQTHETKDDGVVYDVFDPNGQFVNKVVLPRLAYSCVMAHGFIYQVETPDDSPATIKRYTIN
jgi:hypothetical protein